jgi:hypothetical protein
MNAHRIGSMQDESSSTDSSAMGRARRTRWIFPAYGFSGSGTLLLRPLHGHRRTIRQETRTEPLQGCFTWTRCTSPSTVWRSI